LEEFDEARLQWLMPIILATYMADIEGTVIRDQPWQVFMTPSHTVVACTIPATHLSGWLRPGESQLQASMGKKVHETPISTDKRWA
jgi:hypothetical protein